MNSAQYYFCTGILCGSIGAHAMATANDIPTAPDVPENSAVDQPNAMGQVSQRLLDYLLEMVVDRTTSVNDNVLGTSVRGLVTSVGRVIPQLVPSPDQGILQLRFLGTARSPRMIGRNGPATIISSAFSNVDVRKKVVLSDQGLRLLPAEASVETRLSIDSVTANRRLVERIAQRRANRSYADAKTVTSQRTKSRLQQEVDRDAVKPLGQAHDYFVRGFRKPLLERDSLPKLFRFTTTKEHLRLILQQCSHSQWPTPEIAPEMNSQHDIVVALHETAISSIYEVFFGGQTARDRDCLHTAHLITGDDPRPLRVHARTPAWSVTMTERRPLEMTFDDGHATIVLHLKSLRYGERQFEGDFQVTVRYHLEKTSSGPVLTRQGDLEVQGALDRGFNGELEAVSILRTKFSAVFPPTLMFEGLVPPTGGIWGKIRQLELVQLDAKDGWLIVGYRLPRPKKLS